MYVFGGIHNTNSELVESAHFYCIDVQTKKMVCLQLPEDTMECRKVYGSTSKWFDDHTLVINSGTRPALGVGFRSIFCYSKFENREMVCESDTCIIQNKCGNIPWVQCDLCSKWIHNFCDPKIRKRETTLKRSERYHCQKCREKNQ